MIALGFKESEEGMRTVAGVALAGYLVWLVVAFGLRAALLRSRTGTAGFRGISGPVGSLSWWAGVLFVVAVFLGLAALAAAIAGVVVPPESLARLPVWIAGAILAVLGATATVAAQAGMGESWRVGVDDHERTALVTGGVFGWVRNPIFTAMAVGSLGWLLLVPTWLSVLALVALVMAVQLQVRVVEEPYLLRAHGERYRMYAGRVGRFLPAVGRLGR